MGQAISRMRGLPVNYTASQVVNLNIMKQALFPWHYNEIALEIITIKVMFI